MSAPEHMGIVYRHRGGIQGPNWSPWQKLLHYNIFCDAITKAFEVAEDLGSEPITKLRFDWGKHGQYDFRKEF